jgi:uncharacterized protein
MIASLPTLAVPPMASQTGGTAELGANWRLQFADPDGVPLSMISFEQIDFGAISYKEIFQNVKTILATPLFSAALERTLGLDNTIVDRPIQDAAHATIAILDAVMQWEPRCQIMNIDFEADAINGHLIVKLQLDVKNVIYGTNTAYTAQNIYDKPAAVTGRLPSILEPPVIEGPPGPPGETGPPGERGSLWFTGVGPPTTVAGAQEQDMYLDTSSGDIAQLQSTPTKKSSKPPAPKPGPPGAPGAQGPQGRRATKWWFGTNDPGEIPGALSSDLYLNTVTGDIWQMQGLIWKKVSNAQRVD